MLSSQPCSHLVVMISPAVHLYKPCADTIFFIFLLPTLPVLYNRECHFEVSVMLYLTIESGETIIYGVCMDVHCIQKT